MARLGIGWMRDEILFQIYWGSRVKRARMHSVRERINIWIDKFQSASRPFPPSLPLLPELIVGRVVDRFTYLLFPGDRTRWRAFAGRVIRANRQFYHCASLIVRGISSGLTRRLRTRITDRDSEIAIPSSGLLGPHICSIDNEYEDILTRS